MPQQSGTSQWLRGCRDSVPSEWLCTSAPEHATVAKQLQPALATAEDNVLPHSSPEEEKKTKEKEKKMRWEGRIKWCFPFNKCTMSEKWGSFLLFWCLRFWSWVQSGPALSLPGCLNTGTSVCGSCAYCRHLIIVTHFDYFWSVTPNKSYHIGSAWISVGRYLFNWCNQLGYIFTT